ncbi:MAG: hypothetical protein IAE78_00145 [Myxococcus sp.]|nr:hypothetical protein [Myxococcus sp.]
MPPVVLVPPAVFSSGDSKGSGASDDKASESAGDWPPKSTQEPVEPKLLHPKESLSKASYEYWSKQSTETIIRSLEPGPNNPEGLLMKADGTVMQGNTRLTVLNERGVDVKGLPYELKQ